MLFIIQLQGTTETAEFTSPWRSCLPPPAVLPLLQFWNTIFWRCSRGVCIDSGVDDVGFLDQVLTQLPRRFRAKDVSGGGGGGAGHGVVGLCVCVEGVCEGCCGAEGQGREGACMLGGGYVAGSYSMVQQHSMGQVVARCQGTAFPSICNDILIDRPLQE
jgi:hypothetical protein